MPTVPQAFPASFEFTAATMMLPRAAIPTTLPPTRPVAASCVQVVPHGRFQTRVRTVVHIRASEANVPKRGSSKGESVFRISGHQRPA